MVALYLCGDHNHARANLRHAGIYHRHPEFPVQEQQDMLIGMCEGCRHLGRNFRTCLRCNDGHVFQVAGVKHRGYGWIHDFPDEPHRGDSCSVDSMFLAMHMPICGQEDRLGVGQPNPRGYTPPDPTTLMAPLSMQGISVEPNSPDLRDNYRDSSYEPGFFDLSYPTTTQVHERRLVMEALLCGNTGYLYQEGTGFHPVLRTMITEWETAQTVFRAQADVLIAYHSATGTRAPVVHDDGTPFPLWILQQQRRHWPRARNRPVIETYNCLERGAYPADFKAAQVQHMAQHPHNDQALPIDEDARTSHQNSHQESG